MNKNGANVKLRSSLAMDGEERTLLLTIMHLLREYTKCRIRMLKLLFFIAIMRLNDHQHLTASLWKHFNNTYRHPRAWQLQRPQHEFNAYFSNQQPDLGYWKENFRMHRETFEYICNICAPFLQDTRLRRAVPLPKRVAVALYWLAKGGSVRKAGTNFGVSRSASQEIICDFVDRLFEMRNDFIKFPVTLEDYKKAIRSFEGKTHLPNVFGAIDGTHWEISKPFWSGSAVDYFSRKQKYTIVNQGVCDRNLMFLAAESGFLGSIHDSRMFDHTWLAEALKNNENLQVPIIPIEDDVSLKPYLLGDPAYHSIS